MEKYKIKVNPLIAGAIACALAFICVLGLCACSSDKDAIKGEWQVQDTDVTVVFTDTQWKMVQNTFDYSVDTDNKTISYSADGLSGSASYELSSDNNQLTLKEDDGEGGVKTTVFVKLSSDTSKEPSAGGSDSDSDSEQ